MCLANSFAPFQSERLYSRGTVHAKEKMWIFYSRVNSNLTHKSVVDEPVMRWTI